MMRMKPTPPSVSVLIDRRNQLLFQSKSQLMQGDQEKALFYLIAADRVALEMRKYEEAGK